MSTEKASALVLRAVDFSETSLVVTLFTREFGKVSGLAKGGRRPKGPFEAALDLLSECRIVFLRKSSDTLDLLTEAKLERRFRTAGRDLSSLYAGYYVAELLRELTHESDPHPELYDAACNTLHLLSAGHIPVPLVVMRFELLLLRSLGMLPSLEECVECGTNVEPGGRVAFGLASGGVFCARCRPGKSHVASLSAGAWEAMRRIAEPGEDWIGLPVETRVSGELRGVLNHYLNHLLGYRPRLQAYLTG